LRCLKYGTSFVLAVDDEDFAQRNRQDSHGCGGRCPRRGRGRRRHLSWFWRLYHDLHSFYELDHHHDYFYLIDHDVLERRRLYYELEQ
jgi:hypothetical protein